MFAPLTNDEATELSKRYDTPLGIAHPAQDLKERIRLHYDLASDYYLSLWGEHIHHGYWQSTDSQTQTKEEAQINLIRLLIDISNIQPGSIVIDVGCGIGGTSRYLASKHGCTVIGITISSKQVEIAYRLSRAAASGSEENKDGFIHLGPGKVKFIVLDAEEMGDFFDDQEGSFDAVWISEALSHFPNKPLFFAHANKLLKPGGTLVLADWCKADNLDEMAFVNDIKPIEDGMLLPALCIQQDYVEFATQAGLQVLAGPKDISQEVRKTWDLSWSLVQNPSLWAFASSQGRDGIAFLQAFRAMRRGYANRTFRFIVMSLIKDA